MKNSEVIKILESFKESGSTEDLEEMTGEDNFKELCLLGFIKKGSDGDKQTFQITPFGFDQIEFYREPNQKEKEISAYLVSLGV